jgi:SNF2 family DNA or RNA helicase
MLAMDMGTGKSKVAVDIACSRGYQRILIVCPRSVLGVWPREFERHAECSMNVVAPRKGTIPKRSAAVTDALAQQQRSRTPEAVVAVVNYEAAWRSPMAELLLETKWDLVILDESHRIKAPGGKASMFCARLRRSAAQRLCLTGTPMPHSPLDVYAQYRFLDPGIFGTSFAAFRARYAVMGGYGGHEVLGYQRQDELAERMYRIGYRVMADDVLDLPPAVHERRTTELSPKGRKVYDSLAKSLYADIEAGQVTASNALVRLLRLQQVTSGQLPVDDSDVIEIVDESKRALLSDVLEDLPTEEPVVVFCRFTHDLDSVREVCEKQDRRYGELSGRRKDGLTDHAEMNPDIDVIGVQIQAGGVGIDLTRARYCIFHSVGYSLGDYEQALKRTHRPGQQRSVIYVHLIVDDTVDVKVHEALQDRRDLVEHVLGMGG